MGRFRADADSLQQSESHFTEAETYARQVEKDLKGILSDIDPTWKGLTAQSFKSYILDFIDEFNSINQTLNELKRQTKDIKETARLLDVLYDRLGPVGFENLMKDLKRR